MRRTSRDLLLFVAVLVPFCAIEGSAIYKSLAAAGFAVTVRYWTDKNATVVITDRTLPDGRRVHNASYWIGYNDHDKKRRC